MAEAPTASTSNAELVRWTCRYCNKPQTTPNLRPIQGETVSYHKLVQEAAKNGRIACWTCYHRFSRRS